MYQEPSPCLSCPATPPALPIISNTGSPAPRHLVHATDLCSPEQGPGCYPDSSVWGGGGSSPAQWLPTAAPTLCAPAPTGVPRCPELPEPPASVLPGNRRAALEGGRGFKLQVCTVKGEAQSKFSESPWALREAGIEVNIQCLVLGRL
jgi:hypothetical protein